MLLDTAISEVQQICGWRSDKVAEIIRALSYAQTEREKPNRTYPWFLRKENPTAITTIVGQPQYSIPSDYIEDTEEVDGNLFYYTLQIPASRTIFLKKQSFKNAQIRYYGEWPYVYTNPPGAILDTGSYIAPGVPREYYLGDTFVLLYPRPDAVYQISWRYWATDAAQALGQENKWLKNAPWVLIGHAATKLCMDLGYQQGQQTGQQVMQSAEENLFRAVIGRSEAGRRRNMGSRL